ncbi:hypothetical protein M9Y10_033868 [Tritrichomonas musculus]|uniref:Uncharacterized protein n=1 Tax=Tritrichomonas musculus TaxID=1915356 RepID=A0ABR2KDC4_9EUKA
MTRTPTVAPKSRVRDVVMPPEYQPSPARSVSSKSSKHSIVSNASSYAAASAKSVSPEILEELLDTIENNANLYLTHPIELLEDLRIQLERLKEFSKKRSAEPLFNLVNNTYRHSQTTTDEKKQLYILMTNINTVCDPNEMKDLYHKNRDNSRFSKHFLERCYQHFKQTSSSKTLTPKDLPVSLVVQNEFTPRKDIEFAFTCLSNWESSYDGVRRIWELIKNEPDIDLDDYFDSLDFTQKCFLIAGLYSNMRDEKMENLQPIIEDLDSRTMNETKSDRVQREAQRVGEKMNELIKTETPKIKRFNDSTSTSFIRSPASSTSSKVSMASRDIRQSPILLNDSSISSKVPLKAAQMRANINPSASISSRSSKTPTISRNGSSAASTAFGLPGKSRKSILKSATPTQSGANQNSNANVLYNQNNGSSYSRKSYKL